MATTLQELLRRGTIPQGENDLEALTRHLKQRLGRIPKCPLCDHSTLILAGPSGQVLIGYNLSPLGTIERSGELFPLIALVCNNCAYTMQFAWTHVLGHRESEPPDGE